MSQKKTIASKSFLSNFKHFLRLLFFRCMGGGGQALNGGLLAVLGWDIEILARKFSKLDCMVDVKNFHFLKRPFLTIKGICEQV